MSVIKIPVDVSTIPISAKLTKIPAEKAKEIAKALALFAVRVLSIYPTTRGIVTRLQGLSKMLKMPQIKAAIKASPLDAWRVL
ncbi:hypothetical protein SDC9_198005 [bioreactor metagenome]|jgi:hypothetical protein|uniref:Uncharacterized protein n=1 Tax=bioreactor metagenome TaxID=1076179 RepID=A0A645IIS3_9ZZZZ